MMNLQTPRGTKDLLPEEMKIREQVFGKLKNVVESYGFQPIETPALESFELLAKKSGEQIKEEIYYFKDKGDREIALRFDGTVPVARVVASNIAMPKPIKFYYISRFWRYDEPQAGRLREFWQLGIELIGSKSPLADAEAIACAVDCMKAVGLGNFEVRLNSKKIVEGFARLNGIKDLPAFFRLLDKKEKISETAFFSELENKLGMDRPTFEQLANPESFSEPKILEGLSEIKELSSILLNDYEIGTVKMDPLLVRGIDYYDGLVFEVKAGDYKLTIAGGGRYDSLIGLYGPEKLPATGWAMGLERLMEVMKKAGTLPVPGVAVDVLVVPIDKMSLEKDAVKIAQSLRTSGLSCDLELMERGLGKSLEYASKAGVKFVIIVGKNEIAEGKIVLKDMTAKTEDKVKIAELSDQITLKSSKKL